MTPPIFDQIFRTPTEGLKSTVTLNNGVKMPWFGLGVWQIRDDRETETAVRTALEFGYRSIDTASIYGNERGVGQAIRSAGVPREQLFITTKLWNDDVRRGRAEAALDESLQRLGLDYVDLYLVHWPIAGKITAAWQAMEKLLSRRRVKAIGVSNHLRPHLDELLASASVVPAVNQIEFHPYLQSSALVAHCRSLGLQVEAWSPLMQAGALLRDPALVAIAKKHGKSVAQIILRWDLQRGIVTIPKSVRRERLAENAGIFDFTLTDTEVAAINALERGTRNGADPMNFSF